LAHLWDSGANAIDELNRLMQVRGAAAEAASAKNNIREGAPLETLEDVLVPLIYASSLSGGGGEQTHRGMDYTFALRGDGQNATQIVAPADSGALLRPCWQR